MSADPCGCPDLDPCPADCPHWAAAHRVPGRGMNQRALRDARYARYTALRESGLLSVDAARQVGIGFTALVLAVLGWCSCCGRAVEGMEPAAYKGRVQVDYHQARPGMICIGSRSVMRRYGRTIHGLTWQPRIMGG